jgi:sortase A
MVEGNVAAHRGSPARRAVRAGLRLLEAGLAVLGVACLVAYGASCARTSYTQSTQSEAFDLALEARAEQIRHETHDHSEWSAARIAAYEESLSRPVEALGRLEIPAADVSVMVLEGTDETTLDRAVGRIPGTARVGEDGNLGIAGHRDGFFRGLRHVEAGDEIILTTLDGVARYRIEKTRVVSPKQVEVLAKTEEPTLTLVTCYPFYYVGDAPERFIVQARRVGFEAWQAPANDAALAAR